MNRRPHSIVLALVAGLVFACGCAAGIEDNGDDGTSSPDAQEHVTIDASPLPIDAAPLPIDANLPIDASLPIDAAPGGLDLGATCSTSSQCSSGCCFIGICYIDPGIPGACS